MTDERVRKWCIAPYCEYGKDNDQKPAANHLETTFHHFPSNESRRKDWVDATPKKDFTVEQVTNNTYLCGHHFTSSAYIAIKTDQRESRGSELKRSLLRTDAVPSIWPNCPAYLSKLEVINGMHL